MADTETTTEPNPAASPTEPAAPSASPSLAFSPEQLAWIEAEKRKASDAAAAAARRAEQEKAKPRPATHTNPTAAPVNPPAADDVTSILALRDAFDDVVGDLPIKSSQRSLLREAVMRDRPADVAGYVTRFAERAGWNTAVSPAPQPAVPASPAPVTPAPAVPSTLRAPPPPTPTVTDSTPILSMSPGDREALVQRIGVEEFHKRLMPELVKTRVRLTP